MLNENLIRGKIRSIKDYPKKGIVFRDITTLLKDGKSFRYCIDQIAYLVMDRNIDYVVGMEARGFIFGSALAYRLGKGFIPIRKKGKLPYHTVKRDYALEYGSATLEMHTDAIEKGSRVLIIDDLLATGGTAKAAAELVEEVGGKIDSFVFLVELGELKGRKKLPGYEIISLLKY
jgi:adenine phosphoribosyltransferase